MHNVLLLGAGKIGNAIARFLSTSGDFNILVGDHDAGALQRLANTPRLSTIQMEVSDSAALTAAMKSRQSVVSACSFNVNPGIASAALESGCSYFDLTEYVATTHK